jgi:hypothetical protein
VTTEDGYGEVVASLLGNGGAIHRLASEYRLRAGALRCTLDDIFVIRSRSGKPLWDIQSSAESRDAGGAIGALGAVNDWENALGRCI